MVTLRRSLRRRASHRNVLIIVQNLPVPFDRRVWLECQALVGAGYQVSVVCPKGPGDPDVETIDGVRIHKYRPYAPGGSKLSFVAEYVYCFVATARLTLRARRAAGRFGAVQLCNPPDIFWPLAAGLRLLDGSVFVFDHHDLCPELFESRFDGRPRLVHRALLAMERTTHLTADHVIATNDSYREVAIRRSGKSPDDVSVVRTGPDADRLKRRTPDQTVRRGHEHLVAYLGVMGPQDGADICIRAADVLVKQFGRTDIAFTLMGGGDCFDELVELRDRLALGEHVELTGRVPDEFVFTVLSTADIGLSPDPKNPLNDVSTMNKTMEYMAFELPVVAFDLKETRVSAGEAAVYVQPNDVERYAKAIAGLVDDPELRASMGTAGRRRVEQELAWDHQRVAYIRVYEHLLSPKPQPVAVDHWGRADVATR